MTIGPEYPEHPRQLTCPLCGGTSFDKHVQRADSRWGFTTHKITMMVCQRCSYILHFYNHRSLFDFD